MKLFASKKRKTAPDACDATSKVTQDSARAEESVRSYFDDGTVGPRSGGVLKKKVAGPETTNEDIARWANEDPSTLTSKQRRLVKRWASRKDSPGNPPSAEEVVPTEVDGTDAPAPVSEPSGPEGSDSAVPDGIEATIVPDQADGNLVPNTEGMNARERRKFLRESKFKESTEDRSKINIVGKPVGGIPVTPGAVAIAAPEDAVIESSTLEGAAQLGNSVSKKEELSESNSKGPNSKERRKLLRSLKYGVGTPEETSAPPQKKGRKSVNSTLSKEEADRREEQRRKQKEAAERRAAGQDAMGPGFKHPLNSERRRANRRKPGKAGKIARARKEKREQSIEKKSSNHTGYMIRKGGGGGYQ